ncbi:SRPBCC family protein [Pseudonocardia alaniniphila]|uniref:SRPBCC family protein n=1 Tax=Pseudonocardia alaniniphila TaxID=75291 RepID=A0ABS9TJF7_9PSEU|nr:SRPBCC family protein [Pseudonocardia alaniniphila]MCH6168660.1 SRPBCC family protein [Pseudonocardia alaniniphila]
MLIDNEFEVAAPVDRVWAYLLDVPNLVPCLPGAVLVGDDGDGTYQGKVTTRLGPVRLNFSGTAKIVDTDEAAHRMVLEASGSEDRGKGTAEMTVTATLRAAGRGTRVHVAQDLTVSGAAAQFGRGMIADVTSVLLNSFAECLQYNIDNQGSADQRGGATATAVRAAAPASGLAIGLRATVMALKRVFARFFLPYDASRLR